MSYSVAVVGAGPTAIYSLQALLAGEHLPGVITIYERQRRAGQGTPYSANWSDPIMLANIASIEIPSLPQSLEDWVQGQPDHQLARFGIVRKDINERAFFPRLVLGEYLAAQFAALIEHAHSQGVEIDVRTQSTVADVAIAGEKISLTVIDSRDAKTTRQFDYVILATGHQWPTDPETRPGYFTSPWPASALARIRNCPVAIRGTSLSAIDASVALANQHGGFVESADEQLEYRAAPGTEQFSLTLFSRKGILPEADFYHPIPYEALEVCNSETIQRLIAAPTSEGLLDAAFELFRQELMRADPDYAKAIGINELSLEDFSEAYFARRADTDPFAWAHRNLEAARADFKNQYTVPWRYAILRMHEVFGLLPPHLGDRDFERFTDSIKPVFVDNYATVPHESIKRILALHRAGKLTVQKLDRELRLDTRSPSRGATLIQGEKTTHFPVFIEATGQKPLSAQDFPFPSLRRQGVIQDAKGDDDLKETRGIAVDGSYHPISAFETSNRLFCLSLPFLLGQHPFAQGITSSAEMADVVADAIQDAESTIRASTVGSFSHVEAV